MAEYIYKTVTEQITIEVDPRWVRILDSADDADTNAQRKHTRPDHKYAYGTPLSLESLDYEGEWFDDHSDGIIEATLLVELEIALSSLTKLQRSYFKKVRLEGYSFTEIARIEGKHKVTIGGIVKDAEKKLKSFFK